MPPVIDEDDRWARFEHRGVIWAAGAAAVLLVALLVWAVVGTSTSDSVPGVAPEPPSSSAPTSTSTTLRTVTGTSYPLPAPRTSQDGGIPAPGAPLPPPEQEVPPGGGPSSSETPTTIYNPYAPTTTQGSADSI